MSKVSMNPFVPLNSKAFGAFAIGFKLIRHHDEAVVARRAPVLDVLQHRRFIRHALKALKLDLGGLAAIQRRMRLVLVEGPRIDVALGGLERFSTSPETRAL